MKKNTESANKSSQKKAYQNTQISKQQAENIPPFTLSAQEKDSYTLQHLETNLSRVSLQQDALMPLLQIIEYIPAIQRTDSIVKGLLRKVDESEQKITKNEKILEKKIKDNCLADTDKNIKKQQKNLEKVNHKIKSIEKQMNNLYRWYETKLKDESTLLHRSMELKLEKQKSEMQKSFSNETQKTITHSKQQSISNPENSHRSRDILSRVEFIIENEVAKFKQDMTTNMNQLQKEIEEKQQTLYE